MILSARQRLILLFSATFGVVLVSAAALFFWLLPKLSDQELLVNQKRTTLASLSEAQNNLQALRADETEITNSEARLDSDIWKFSAEDSFYNQMTKIARDSGAKIDDPGIDDAAPTGLPLIRKVTLNLQGTEAQLQAALDQIQQTKPLISIQKVTNTIGPSATMTIEATTIWQ